MPLAMTIDPETEKGNLVILDASVTAGLSSEGFAVLPFLDPGQMLALEELFATHVNIDRMNSRFDTLTEVTVETRNALSDGILSVCRKGIDRVFQNYKVMVGMFYGKKSDPETELGLHLDPSMTIDPFHHYGIWIPLIDADDLGGEFCLLPGSMHFSHRYQALSIPSPYGNVYGTVRPRMTCLKVKAGSAVIFHNNLLHYSKPNVSGRLRLGVVIKLIDANAPLVIAHGQDTPNGLVISLIGVAEGYYLTDAFRKSDRPDGLLVGTIMGHQVFTESEMLTLLDSMRSR